MTWTELEICDMDGAVGDASGMGILIWVVDASDRKIYGLIRLQDSLIINIFRRNQWILFFVLFLFLFVCCFFVCRYYLKKMINLRLVFSVEYGCLTCLATTRLFATLGVRVT